MEIKIEVNRKIVKAAIGETILAVLQRNGIKVPTLCSMKDLSPTGACRMCVVEVEGFDNLVPACSYPVQEWMKIKTHSPRVLQARKINVELLLSNHPDDCLYCERNGNCELQKLAEDLNVRNRNIHSNRITYKIDTSSKGIIRDQSKCIFCGRCVRICEDIIGVSSLDFKQRGDHLQIATAMSEPLQFSNCIECGQCVVSCPTAALTDNTQFQDIDRSLDDPEKIVAVQYTPEVTVSLADEFGMKPGTDMKGLINNALRKIGFDYVFDTSYGGDVYIMELSAEFVRRYKMQEALPMISSRCPAWVNYVEEFRPDLFSNLLPIRSPHQIIGKLIKTWFAGFHNLSLNRIHSVLVTNCTAAKHEALRTEYTTNNIPDIDFVITTRELARLIRLNGIDMQDLDAEPSDGPFSSITSAGKLLANAGGEMEASLRTVYRDLHNKEIPESRNSKLRGSKFLREVSLKYNNEEILAAAVNGLKNAIRLFDELRNGKPGYDLIEVMACHEGCINGGGQPIPASNEVCKARSRSIYVMDKNDSIKMAHKNSAVLKMYSEIAGNPGSDESRELFLAKFNSVKVLK